MPLYCAIAAVLASFTAKPRLDNLQSTAGGFTYNYAYDNRGNVTWRNNQNFGFDLGNRLTTAANLDTYVYDGFGRRVKTSAIDGTVTVSIYSPAGRFYIPGERGTESGPVDPVHLSAQPPDRRGEEMMVAPIMLKRALHLLALLLLLWTLGLSGTGYAQTRALAEPAADAARVPPPDEEPYNGGYFADQSVPTTMTAGAVYTVTVRMVNNGTTTWSASTSHALGSQNPQDNGTWGGGRVGLSGNVLPGRIATFTFQVTAPANPGSYNFQWKMVQDGVQWFGAPSNNVVVNVVAAPRNGAQFITQSVPASMTTGAQYPVSLTFSNTGNTTWDPTNGKYVLLAVNPVNNETWVYSRIPLSGPVAPGQQTTVAWTTRAPSTPGTYNFQWIILQEGVELIGTPSNNVAVVVSAPLVNGAAFVGHSVPATMTPGQTYNATVIMQNTGTTTWTAGESYRLGSSNPLGNSTWTTTRIEPPGPVAPGQTATFNFQVIAPNAPGTYNFQWNMLREWVEWFGAPSPNLTIQVATQGDTVTYIHTDALGSPVARSDSAGNVISRTSYEPYGRTAGGVTPTIGFTGHVNDADTGLVYMQQRYYDPVAGRFLSVDPVTTDANTGGSFSRFFYANNNPYNFIDPDGRFSQQACDDMGRMNCTTVSGGAGGEASGGAAAVAASAAWQAHEIASAAGLRAAGYTVETQVAITWEGAKGSYTVIDAVGVKGGRIVLLEAKDGIAAKLSSAQKSLFAEALKGGRISLMNTSVAERLGLSAGTALGGQGMLISSVNNSVAGARAAGQFTRLAAQGGYISRGFLGGVAASVAIWMVLTHIGETGGCSNGVCSDTMDGYRR